MLIMKQTVRHSLSKLFNVAIFSIVFATMSVSSAMANQSTPQTKIRYMENWGGNSNNAIFIKTTESSPTNPANCSYTGNYLISSSMSETSRAMLLSAFMADQNIKLTIYSGGCANNRPSIVAVRLEK